MEKQNVSKCSQWLSCGRAQEDVNFKSLERREREGGRREALKFISFFELGKGAPERPHTGTLQGALMNYPLGSWSIALERPEEAPSPVPHPLLIE